MRARRFCRRAVNRQATEKREQLAAIRGERSRIGAGNWAWASVCLPRKVWDMHVGWPRVWLGIIHGKDHSDRDSLISTVQRKKLEIET